MKRQDLCDKLNATFKENRRSIRFKKWEYGMGIEVYVVDPFIHSFTLTDEFWSELSTRVKRITDHIISFAANSNIFFIWENDKTSFLKD